MTALVQMTLAFRRSIRASFGLLTVAVLVVLDLLEVFRVHPAELGVEHYLVGGFWLLVLLARLKERACNRQRESKQQLLQLELGLLAIVGLHAALQLLGGLGSPFYPAAYVLMALLCSFSPRKVALALVAFAIAFESALFFLAERHTDPAPLLVHAAFLAVFGLLNLVITQAEIVRVRHRSRQELEEEKKRMREDARLFRLIGAPTDSAARDEEKLFRSSVEQVHQALLSDLQLLKRTMELHTCAFLALDESGEKLRVGEIATESEEIAEGPFSAGGGAVGGAIKRGLVVNLEHIRPGYGGICYYAGPAPVRALLAVPVKENGQICGVLCCDRVEDRPFTPREEEILGEAVDHLVRTMENERVFVQLERSKREQNILYRASQALGSALDEEAVLDAALGAVAEIAPYDFAAVTRYDADTRRHTVRRAAGDGAESFANLSFRDNMSLTAMAVKNRHYLPYRGEFDSEQQTVYTRNANLRGMDSLLILPLVVRETAIGTLALATRRKNAFRSSVRPALQVVANQLAVALSNARLVARLELQATTDGLTGCFNKRTFQEELDQKMKAAERFNRSLSLVVTDIDHFKSVNDTYGHSVGDVVLQELGQILRRTKRETDVVARYGGEEFCLLCEQTDTKGALQLAERVREELANTTFQTELGRLKVTCSSGVATFPGNAKNKDLLFELADRAMYAAKQSGRNRVRAVGMTDS